MILILFQSRDPRQRVALFDVEVALSASKEAREFRASAFDGWSNELHANRFATLSSVISLVIVSNGSLDAFSSS